MTGIYYGHTSLGVFIAAQVCVVVILLVASLYRRKKLRDSSGAWKQTPRHKWLHRIAWTVGIIVLLYAALVALGTLLNKHSSAGGNRATASAASDLKTLVLRPGDVPRGFTVKARHFVSLAAFAKSAHSSASELRKWGYVNGYLIDFYREASSSRLVRGIIAVESEASLYRSHADVTASLARSKRACKRPVGTKIGNAAFVCSYVRKSGGNTFQVCSVVWRRGRLKAYVTVVGLRGRRVAPNQAVSLAKVQNSRMP